MTEPDSGLPIPRLQGRSGQQRGIAAFTAQTSSYRSIDTAAQVVRDGGVVAYPTESCFGLGCDPSNAAAVGRILRMKRRAPSKGLILLADRTSRFGAYVEEWPEERREEILGSWPGPFTWLVPAGARTRYWVRGDHSSVAVRVTAHRLAARLSRMAGMPVVSTSANRAGRRMLRSARDVRREFGMEVDFIVDAPIGRSTAPSTIRDGLTGRIIRA